MWSGDVAIGNKNWDFSYQSAPNHIYHDSYHDKWMAVAGVAMTAHTNNMNGKDARIQIYLRYRAVPQSALLAQSNTLEIKSVLYPNFRPIALSGGDVDPYPNGADSIPACTSECDHDEQCAEGLVCFQRNPGDTREIPGCRGTPYQDYDYCHNPKPWIPPSNGEYFFFRIADVDTILSKVDRDPTWWNNKRFCIYHQNINYVGTVVLWRSWASGDLKGSGHGRYDESKGLGYNGIFRPGDKITFVSTVESDCSTAETQALADIVKTSVRNSQAKDVRECDKYGCIAHYPLQGDARDASGNGFHGTTSAELEYVWAGYRALLLFSVNLDLIMCSTLPS
jgi:hypothetical protein